MENDRVKYHFSLQMNFKTDVDVEKVSKLIKLEPYKITPLSEAKGPNKTAKIWYRTKDFTEIYSDNMIDKFLKEVEENLKFLPELLKEFEGRCSLNLIFTGLNEFPVIGLSDYAIQTLAKLKINFYVDFLV